MKQLKKFLFLIILLAGFFNFFVFSIKAASLTSNVALGNQYPWNKEFEVIVNVKPSESLQKLVIQWDNVNAVEIKKPILIAKNLKESSSYSFKFKMVPKIPGDHTLHANIVGYTTTSTVADAVDLSVHFDKSLNLPKNSTYYMYLLGYIIAIIIFIVVLGFILYKGGKYLVYEFIPKWIHKQKEKPI